MPFGRWRIGKRAGPDGDSARRQRIAMRLCGFVRFSAPSWCRARRKR